MLSIPSLRISAQSRGMIPASAPDVVIRVENSNVPGRSRFFANEGLGVIGLEKQRCDEEIRTRKCDFLSIEITSCWMEESNRGLGRSILVKEAIMGSRGLCWGASIYVNQQLLSIQ